MNICVLSVCVCYERHCFIVLDNGYSIDLPKSKYLKFYQKVKP